jgi:hypothetical protein
MFIVSAHSRFAPIDIEKAAIRIARACRMTSPIKKTRMIGGKSADHRFATDLQRPRHFPIFNDPHDQSFGVTPAAIAGVTRRL